jgi:pimeloyl-ACP methyl ester carboxylesterase
MPRLSPRLRTVLLPLLVVAAIAAVGFAALVGLVWWAQERIVFQPPGSFAPWAGADDHVTRRVDYRAADGQPLFAFVVRPRRTADPEQRGPSPVPRGVVIVFHGNADLASSWIGWGGEVAERTGLTVVAAEYRGYGGLPGTPTYEGSKLDARAAYAFVRDSLGARPEHVFIYGHSLGSAIGAELAAEVRPRALLLESPLTSARAMARIVVARPVVALWRVIARVHYDTEARVRALDAPVHVAHGERDAVIPVHMGRAVHAAARVKGGLLIVRGAGHNDVQHAAGGDYWRWLGGALGAAD